MTSTSAKPKHCITKQSVLISNSSRFCVVSTMWEEEREEYYREKAIEVQKGIVNYKSCSTTTSESFMWTYRTTGVDVLSVITTTVPVTNGGMKDILMKNREIKRLKLAKKSNKADLSCSPFDISLSVDKDSKRKRMNSLLLSEQRKFMAKLNSSRAARLENENLAATLLQKVFRGYFVRNYLSDLSYYADMNKKIRSNIRSYLASKYKMNLSMATYKRSLTNARNQSAVTIQSAYFRYLSRKALRRRKYELWLKRRRIAVVKIQAMVRGASSRARVTLLVERLRIVLFNKSATVIQVSTRRHLARRRVHRRRYRLYCIASRIIINWYRTRYTRKMAAHIKAMLQFRRNRNGAMAMQCLVRQFLAKRRVVRIRLRMLHKLIFGYVTRIQCMIRRFICRARVQHKRQQVHADKEEADAKLAQKVAAEAAAAQAAETKQLMDGVDLFLQANLGNTTEVVDIYTGLASSEEHSRDEVEPDTGDNLLTIAARLGNLDLVRKCLMWGFDLNHRNEMGFNALMVAAKHNHLSVMQYLLAPPASAADDATPFTPLDPISEEDAGFLLVTSAANAIIDDDTSMLVKILSLGVDVNAKSATTGMTALHAACEVGHVEAFKLLVVKNKADLEVEDDLGQTPLHKACCSSFKITEMILGLDPSFNTYMSDATRSASIMKIDGDGKDCILHAALNGQTDTLELLTSTMQSGMTRTKSGKFTPAEGDASASEEIGWSPNDISKAIKLVESGNLICLNKIAEIGFDVSWVEDETGTTLAMASCKSGNSDMVDLVMSFGVDFSAADAEGKTPMHYAVEYNAAELIPHLMMHASAAKCKVSDACLLQKDNAGNTVFHVAAGKGIELKIDLLAQKVLNDVLATKNNEGKTPLIVACCEFKLEIVRAYMKLGADVQVLDGENRGCLWHLMHPRAEVGRRPLCSEYVLHPSVSAVVPNSNSSSSGNSSNYNLSRKEKDDEIARVAAEVPLFVSLLRAGCALYSDSPAYLGRSAPCTPEKIQAELSFQWNVAPTPASQLTFQCGDIVVQEMCLTLMKTLITEGLLRKYDAWRLLLAAYWFDDGSTKVMPVLFKAGLIDVMTSSDDAQHIQLDFENAVNSANSNGHSPTRQSMAALAMGSTPDTMPLHRLQEQYFNDLSVIGWSIRLSKAKSLQFFLRRGFKVTSPVDASGNPALHFVAMHGTAEMVDMVLSDRTIKLEQLNRDGWTAGMLAAKYKNFPVMKKLYEARVDCRRSLDGSYSGWVLAFVRRREKNEINTQTGRYGDDDVKYFDISPDPFYTTWYTP